MSPTRREHREQRSARCSRRDLQQRRQRQALWAWIFISAMLTHTALLPLAEWLLNSPPEYLPPPLELEVVRIDPPAQKRERLESKKRQRRRRARRARAKLAPPPPTAPPRQKMVELDTPATKRPPDRARFLSDKDRRVARETRAKRTTLQRVPPQQARKLTTQPPPRPRAQRAPPRRPRPLPLLPMRHRPLPKAEAGKLPDLRFREKDYQRVFARQSKRARERARLDPSPRREGRIARKWRRMRAALENFVPEVRPGNQTALNTRANPFAIYISRMHRKIHPLWGWGFLVDLDKKGDANPLNNMKLQVTMEIAVNPDGSLAKAIIVRPSQELTFDVAALDTIFTAGPYPRTPKAIRSANGKVYLHWTFHRNHRQCGTFNVDPYILTTPPQGEVDGKEATVAPRPLRDLRRLNRKSAIRPGWMQLAPRATSRRVSRRARAAAKKMVSAADPAARRLLRDFAAAFRRGESAAMAAYCALPFHARGKVIAKKRTELARMLRSLLQEGSSREVTKLSLMSVIEARRQLKRLPRGASYGAQMLVGRARLGHTDVVLLLQRRDKRWRVVGLNR